MKYKPTILSNDDEFPSKDDLADIYMSKCINCGKPFAYGSPLYFVRLKNLALLWWHRGWQCNPNKHDEI